MNEFVDIKLSSLLSENMIKVNCTFMNQPRKGMKSCEISARPNCSRNISYNSSGSAIDTNSLSVLVDVEDLMFVNETCFVVKASNETKAISVRGTHTNSGD